MRHFVDADGDEYHVKDAAELVAEMHRRAFTKAANDRAYMLGMAERSKLFDPNRQYRTDTFEHFAQDLIAAGFLREV